MKVSAAAYRRTPGEWRGGKVVSIKQASEAFQSLWMYPRTDTDTSPGHATPDGREASVVRKKDPLDTLSTDSAS